MTRTLHRHSGLKRFLSAWIALAFLLSLTSVGYAANPKTSAPSDAVAAATSAPAARAADKAAAPWRSKVAAPVTTEPTSEKAPGSGKAKSSWKELRATAPVAESTKKAPAAKTAVLSAVPPETTEGNPPLCVGGLRIDEEDLPGPGGSTTFPHEIDGRDVHITVTVHETEMGPEFDWSSDWPVTRVVAKGGRLGANVYSYGTAGATSDTGLHCPMNPSEKWAGISHIDFCFVHPAELKVVKYEDLSKDGEWDEGEPMLSGWTFMVHNADHIKIAEATTDEHGAATFEGLAPGTYHIHEVMKDGWTVTTDPYPVPVTLASGDEKTVKVGNAQMTGLTVVKFHDIDRDGRHGEGEPVLEGWTFKLYLGEVLVAEGVTDGDGEVVFDKLDPGHYTLVEVVKEPWYAVTELPLHLELAAGQPMMVHVGNTYDVQKRFTLTYPDKPAGVGAWVQYTVDGGQAILLPLPAGEGSAYTAAIDVPYGSTIAGQWVASYGAEVIPIAPFGPETLTKDLINAFTYDPTVTGSKFSDLNDNGVWDEGEPGLPGWTINLYRMVPAVIGANTIDAVPVSGVWELFSSTVTGEGGAYSFPGLPPGQYKVEEVLQPNWTQTLAPQPFMVSAEAGASGLNFGNHRDDIVKTFRLNYANPPEGTTFSVRFAMGDKFTTLDLAPSEGSYEATVALPAGSTINYVAWLASNNGQSFTLSEAEMSETLERDTLNEFTYTASLSGHKFADDNGNGVWDTAGDTPELGLAGWTIGLYRVGAAITPSALPAPAAGDALVAQTVTGEGGAYSFSGLLPGTYYLAEDPQDGWEQTVAPTGTFVVAAGTALADLNFGNTQIAGLNLINLIKDADKTTAKPGDIITYRLRYFLEPLSDPLAPPIPIIDDYDERYLTPVDVGDGVVADGKITWTDNQTLTADETAEITYTMRVRSDVATGTVIDNVALVDVLNRPTDDWSVKVVGEDAFLPFTGGDWLVLFAAFALALTGGVLLRKLGRIGS